jgi:DNA-binding transcriptional ArsR family regulator
VVDDLSEVFHSLAHEHRRQIIEALALRPHAISELAERRGLSLPAIHKHIAVLEDAGFLRRRKRGRTTFLALQRQPLLRLQAWVEQFHPEWGTDDESLANYADHIQRPPTVPKEPA